MQTQEKGKYLISRVIILLDSNIQFSTKKKKNHKSYKLTGNYLRGKQINRNCPPKDLVADILDKDLKIAMLKMLKEGIPWWSNG